MSLNWKEINLILDELQLPNCHVQGIYQPDYRTMTIELYRPGEPFFVLVSLAPGGARLHRTAAKPVKTRTVPRFAEFLRSRIRGGRIIGAEQVGNDRIVRIEIQRAEESTILWIRLWGGASNVIATQSNGIVLDAFFRRPQRGEISGARFDPATAVAKSHGGSGDSSGDSPGGNAAASGKTPPREFNIRTLPGAGDFNARVADYYRAREEQAERDKLRDRLARYYAGRTDRLQSAREKLRERQSEYEQSDSRKLHGDLIMSNLHRIRRGDEWLDAENYEDGNRPIRIQLNSSLSPAANAEHYYDLHKKARAGLDIVRDELAGVERELAAIGRETETLDSVTDISRLKELWSDVDLQERARRAHGAGEKEERPGLEFHSGRYLIIVGRSALDNDRLLRRYTRGNDIWLHTRDYPGAYVFVKTIPGKSIPLDTLLDAGNLAVFYSKARASGYAELYYTQVKYLRRPREGKRGLVLPTQERNLSVRLDPVRLDRLQLDRDQK